METWICDFNEVCTAWNIAVRKICNLPYTTHRWFLGPLMNQPYISYQLQKRIRFLPNMKTSQNEIVLSCYRNAVRNAKLSPNPPISGEKADFRYIFYVQNIVMFSEQNVYQNIYNLSFIILEAKINFQNAVTFVLVNLDTKFNVQNSLKKKRLLLLYLILIYS